MQTTIKLTGFKELEQKLTQVKGSTAKNKMRKVLKEAGEPIARAARARAPRDELDLVESIDVSPLLNRSQRRSSRKGSFAEVEMHIGPSGIPQGILQEFGTYKEAAQPFMRPAWDGNKMNTLDLIGALAWNEVEKKARR